MARIDTLAFKFGLAADGDEVVFLAKGHTYRSQGHRPDG